MCKPGERLILCTCEEQGVDDIKSSVGEWRFTWKLERFSHTIPAQLDGVLVAPEKQLTDSFSAEDVVFELNDRNCFDFEYTPMEKDLLIIFRHSPDGQRKGFLAFNFQYGRWAQVAYKRIEDIYKTISSGKADLSNEEGDQ